MNWRKMNKVFSNIFTLTLMCLMFLNSYSYASGPNLSPVTDVLTDILQILLGLGGFICVGKLVHIGILYMTSSVVDKSNAKAAVIPWLVGTVVCFGAGWIGPMIIGILKIEGNVLDIQ